MSFTDQLRALGRKPRVHPNGFIQLDLNDAGTRRLHVWRDGIPRQEQKKAEEADKHTQTVS